MTTFEEEYKKGFGANNFVTRFREESFLEHFKDWQPPREKVKIPQFVADWLKKYKSLSIAIDFKALMQDSTGYKSVADVRRWLFADNENQKIFAHAWLDGYEIEEEPKFYLKNKITRHYLAKRWGYFETEDLEDEGKTATEYQFTQYEIDQLDTGSYEKIEVEE